MKLFDEKTRDSIKQVIIEVGGQNPSDEVKALRHEVAVLMDIFSLIATSPVRGADAGKVVDMLAFVDDLAAKKTAELEALGKAGKGELS